VIYIYSVFPFFTFSTFRPLLLGIIMCERGPSPRSLVLFLSLQKREREIAMSLISETASGKVCYLCQLQAFLLNVPGTGTGLSFIYMVSAGY
jgi:hypothetical protein